MSNEKTPERTIRLYNRGQRTFIHGPHRLAPSTFLEVPESVAQLWLKSFENDVIEAAEAQRQIGGANAEVIELRAKLAKAESALAAAKTDPKGDKARAELEHALARIAHLESERKNQTPATAADQV